MNMRVGELSRRTGVGVSTLRAWERRFDLLRPQRSSSGQRLYAEADVERVAAVGRLLAEGLTLSAAATRVAAAGPAVLPAPQRAAFLLPRAVQAVDEAETDAEARFRTAALDAIGEAVIATRPDGTIIYANPASERLLGWRPADLIGLNAIDVLPSPDAADQARRVHANLLAAKRQTGEMPLTRRDGSVFPAHITGGPIADARGGLVAFVHVVRDHSERHRLEHEVRSQEQQAEIVALLGTRVLRDAGHDPVLILTEAVEACRRVLGTDLAALLDVTGPGEDLVVRIASPARAEPVVVPGGSRSVAGYTALAGKVVVVENATVDRRFDLPPTPPWRGPLVSAIAAPVFGAHGVCGVVLVGSTTVQEFSRSAPHFMQSVANVVGMALQPV